MKYDYDIVIIGAGSAGMVAAEAAANMGVKVALVERAQVGGDCLWTGCVPSKTLLASAKAAFTIKHAERYGLRADGFHVDSAGVWQRIRDVQRQIAATDDNPERYAKLGVDILWGEASFAGGHCVQIAGRTVATRFALVCTGSRPAFPPVLGLAGAEPLTSENVFEQERAPGLTRHRWSRPCRHRDGAGDEPTGRPGTRAGDRRSDLEPGRAGTR